MDAVTGGTRWTLARHGLQRVAGLPEAAVEVLRAPSAAAAADELGRRRADASRTAAELADALHPIVPTVGPAPRRELLALRRSAFAGRPCPPGPNALTVLTEQHPGVLDLLDRARRAAESVTTAQARYEETFTAEQDRVRRELRATAADAELRRALCVASPGATRALDRAERGGTVSRKDALRLDRTLLEYVCRAAVKTSPFSGLTSVAPVEFPATSPAGPPAVGSGPRRRVQLSATFLQRLGDQLLADDTTLLDLPVRVSGTVRPDEDFVRTVQRRRSGEVGPSAGAVSLDSDRLLLLRDTAVLRSTLDVLRAAGPAGRPVRELVGDLADRVGEDDGQRLQALRALLRVGVAECVVTRVPVHAPDTARAVADALAGLGVGWADELAARTADLADLADAYAAADGPTRLVLDERLRAAARATFAAVGGDPDRVPTTLLYEDVLADHGVPAHVEVDDSSRADLAVIADLARVLDPLEPHRQHLAGFFVSRFGAGAEHPDVEVLLEDFAEDVYDEYVRWVPQVERFDPDGGYVPHANWLGLPAVAALDEARRGLRDLVSERTTAWVAAGRPDSGIVLSHADLAPVVAALPPDTRRGATANAFLQETGAGPGEGRWVLNKVYGGPGFGWSRFSDLLGRDEVVLEELREQLLPAGAQAPLPVEVLGGEARSNLNTHAPLVPHVLSTPGDPALPADLEAVTVDDLLVRHLPATGVLELRSRRLDRAVVPVYFGYLVPQALPDTARALLLFAPGSSPVLDLFDGVRVEPDERGVVRRPRLRVGGVVLSRGSWTLPARELRVEGGDWVGTRVRVHQHGVPEQGFATASTDGRPRTTKPRYYDVDSPSTWAALEASTDPDDFLTFFERLPGAPAPGTRTREVVVELTREEEQ